MTITLAQWSLSFLALCISTFALLVAFRSLALSRSSRLSVLSTRLSEVEGSVDAIAASIRGLKARIGMAEVRAKRRTEEPEVDLETDDGAEFRRKTNAALAAGQISVIRR
jgi:hypothetical protein